MCHRRLAGCVVQFEEGSELGAAAMQQHTLIGSAQVKDRADLVGREAA
jgi:hypothetical protein